MSEENNDKMNEEVKEFHDTVKKAELELKKLCNEMIGIAKEVKEDYNTLDEKTLEAISGSLTQVHEDSPALDEFFEGDTWKRVIKNVPNLDLSNINLNDILKKEDKNENKK